MNLGCPRRPWGWPYAKSSCCWNHLGRDNLSMNVVCLMTHMQGMSADLVVGTDVERRMIQLESKGGDACIEYSMMTDDFARWLQRLDPRMPYEHVEDHRVQSRGACVLRVLEWLTTGVSPDSRLYLIRR